MAKVIPSNRIINHNIDRYNFKVLALGSEHQDEENEEFKKTSLVQKEEFSEEKNPKRRKSDVDSSALSNSSKESLIESLMQKTDDMSSNFIKLQMKLEDKEEEFKIALQKVKEDSFNEGVEAGVKKVKEENENDLKSGRNQISASIKTLEQSAKDFEMALEKIKADLINAAIDIAQEVISVELSISSSQIAKKLGDNLIEELQGASKITLRVNPKDHGFISEQTGDLEKISIVSDSAVSEGGVIAISDVGNIDAQISKRFERVKKTALSE